MRLSPFELRELEAAHAEPLFAVVDANRTHLRQWLPWLDDTTEVSHVEAFIRRSQDNVLRGIWHEGQIAGVIDLHGIDWQQGSARIGYWLAASVEGKGLMTQACRAMVDLAFERGLHRVEIRCAEGNFRSRAIPVRLGFMQEGLLREAEWLYDHHVDHVVYVMLAQDWQASR